MFCFFLLQQRALESRRVLRIYVDSARGGSPSGLSKAMALETRGSPGCLSKRKPLVFPHKPQDRLSANSFVL